jgi:hypothetical protein
LGSASLHDKVSQRSLRVDLVYFIRKVWTTHSGYAKSKSLLEAGRMKTSSIAGDFHYNLKLADSGGMDYNKI